MIRLEIATPPPKQSVRARLRADFERALLEAAQDRALRRAPPTQPRPWREPSVKRVLLVKVAVPLYRALPWSVRRRLMRMVAGYPKGWPRPE